RRCARRDDEPPAVPPCVELGCREERDSRPVWTAVRSVDRGRVRLDRDRAARDSARDGGGVARTRRPRVSSPAVDFQLTRDQREIQALARDVARAEIEPHAADWDREHRFPRELYPKLAELGLMGVCIPEEYGGSGADFLSYILVLEELSR